MKKGIIAFVAVGTFCLVGMNVHATDCVEDVQTSNEQVVSTVQETGEEPGGLQQPMAEMPVVSTSESPVEEVKNGFVTEDGNSYYYENGTKVTGMKEIEGSFYYFNPGTGAQLFGEQKINGKWYYFEVNSNLPTYGKMVTGFYDLPTKRVYYGSDGVMRYNEQKINGKWYHFHPITGKMTTGFYNLPTKKVYYGSDGVMRYNEQKINGRWYHFHPITGKMTIGFYNLPTKRVYYGSDGTMRYNEQKINGKWYHFHPVTGKMTTGWYELPGKKVYYSSNGTMVYGNQNINGTIYTFHSVTGALLGDNSMRSKAQSYSSSTRWLILVDTKKNTVGIYSGSKNNWTQQKYWSCTTGAASTPTVKGTFTVKAKGLAFGSSYTCWYYTQFYGNYLFHSILYNPGSKTSVQDGRLGINASHGCIRLSLANAKWIYDNIPRNTKVVVY